MQRRVKIASATVGIAAAIALPVAAQYQKPEDAVKYRKAAFTVMGSHAGRIFAQLKSPTPNLQVIQSSATVVEAMSKLPWDAFAPDTEFVRDTRARPELYKNEAKIKDLASRMQQEATKLNTVAQGGDIKAIREQFGVLAKSCDSCHDDFRAK
ncbi:MAG: c-type cytochrome [Burkholderiaceae bacterium]